MNSKIHAMISIRPTYVEGILAGTKTIELRRRFLDLPVGSILWIYSTLPVGAIVAVATLSEIDYDRPDGLWRKYSRDVGIRGNHFDAYFDGCHLGVALRLSDVREITPLSLETIREIRGVRQIPQVAARVSEQEAVRFAKGGRLALA